MFKCLMYIYNFEWKGGCCKSKKYREREGEGKINYFLFCFFAALVYWKFIYFTIKI